MRAEEVIRNPPGKKKHTKQAPLARYGRSRRRGAGETSSGMFLGSERRRENICLDVQRGKKKWKGKLCCRKTKRAEEIPQR